MPVEVRRLGLPDVADVTPMRQALWPDEDAAEIADETPAVVTRADYVVFGAFEEGRLIAMIEVGQRDVAENCVTSPVGYIEGIWVEQTYRRRGIARTLVGAAVTWARSRGFHELASDADIENTISHLMHEALGFTETERLVTFRMVID